VDLDSELFGLTGLFWMTRRVASAVFRNRVFSRDPGFKCAVWQKIRRASRSDTARGSQQIASYIAKQKGKEKALTYYNNLLG
jgi:hypothetical protein